MPVWDLDGEALGWAWRCAQQCTKILLVTVFIQPSLLLKIYVYFSTLI